MKEKVVDYIIVIEENRLKLHECVKERIEQGWVPLGSPFMPHNSDWFYQAMVKYETN